MYGPKTVVKHITVADDNQFEGFFHIFADDAGGNVFGVGIFFEMPENFGRMKVVVNDLRRKQLRYGTGLKQRNKINRGVFLGSKYAGGSEHHFFEKRCFFKIVVKVGFFQVKLNQVLRERGIVFEVCGVDG